MINKSFIESAGFRLNSRPFEEKKCVIGRSLSSVCLIVSQKLKLEWLGNFFDKFLEDLEECSIYIKYLADL